MVWFSDARTTTDVLAQHNTLSPLFMEFYASLGRQTHVPIDTLELCRQRVAQLHENGAELLQQACDVSRQQYAELVSWPSSSRFSDGERACLALAEVYCMDVQAISDEQADAVKAHYGDAGLVALLQALGMYYGLARMSQVWGLEGATK